MFQTGYQFHRSMIQLDNDRRPPVDILLQSMFTPHRLTNAHRFYRTKIYPARKIIIDVPHLTELAQQHRLRTGTQLPAGMYPQNMHLPCRHRTHSPKTLYRQMCYKIQSLVGMNGTQTVGFTVIGCYFGKKLIVGNSGRSTRLSRSRTFRFISLAISTARRIPGLFSVTSRNASSKEIGSMTSVYSWNIS